MGVPKENLFELNGGEKVLLGRARCKISYFPATFQPLQRLIDQIMGDLPEVE